MGVNHRLLHYRITHAVSTSSSELISLLGNGKGRSQPASRPRSLHRPPVCAFISLAAHTVTRRGVALSSRCPDTT